MNVMSPLFMREISFAIISVVDPFGAFGALLTPHLLYRRLGAEGSERQAAYDELVKAPLDSMQFAVVRESSHKGWALGSGRFQAKIERLTQRRTTPLPKGRPKRRED